MRKRDKVVALLVVFGLLAGVGAPSALAAAGGQSVEQAATFVLPSGERLDDDELADVTGRFLPAVVAGALGYVGAKLLDAAWDRYVDPWLEETVWPWLDGVLGR